MSDKRAQRLFREIYLGAHDDFKKLKDDNVLSDGEYAEKVYNMQRIELSKKERRENKSVVVSKLLERGVISEKEASIINPRVESDSLVEIKREGAALADRARGYSDGKEIGLKEGYRSGFDAGKSSVEECVHSENYVKSYYNSGVDKGRKQVISAVYDVLEGHSVGCCGENEGCENERCTGYNAKGIDPRTEKCSKCGACGYCKHNPDADGNYPVPPREDESWRVFAHGDASDTYGDAS